MQKQLLHRLDSFNERFKNTTDFDEFHECLLELLHIIESDENLEQEFNRRLSHFRTWYLRNNVERLITQINKLGLAEYDLLHLNPRSCFDCYSNIIKPFSDNKALIKSTNPALYEEMSTAIEAYRKLNAKHHGSCFEELMSFTQKYEELGLHARKDYLDANNKTQNEMDHIRSLFNTVYIDLKAYLIGDSTEKMIGRPTKLKYVNNILTYKKQQVRIQANSLMALLCQEVFCDSEEKTTFDWKELFKGIHGSPPASNRDWRKIDQIVRRINKAANKKGLSDLLVFEGGKEGYVRKIAN